MLPFAALYRVVSASANFILWLFNWKFQVTDGQNRSLVFSVKRMPTSLPIFLLLPYPSSTYPSSTYPISAHPTQHRYSISENFQPKFLSPKQYDFLSAVANALSDLEKPTLRIIAESLVTQNVVSQRMSADDGLLQMIFAVLGWLTLLFEPEYPTNPRMYMYCSTCRPGWGCDSIKYPDGIPEQNWGRCRLAPFINPWDILACLFQCL